MTLPRILQHIDAAVNRNLGKILLAIIFIALVVGHVGAVPTTGAASLIGSNNVTVACSGTSGDWWVDWGQTVNTYWRSSNITTGDGTYTIHQSPLFGNTVFFYKCEDSTGAGSTLTFTTAIVTPIPPTGLGKFYENMTEVGYDIPSIIQNLAIPYTWNPNLPITIVFMLIFSPVFIGIWLRSRTVLVALIFGFIVGSFILFNQAGSTTGISMPPEIVAISQAIVYVSFAGCILYVVHR